ETSDSRRGGRAAGGSSGGGHFALWGPLMVRCNQPDPAAAVYHDPLAWLHPVTGGQQRGATHGHATDATLSGQPPTGRCPACLIDA
ncbi:MAG TPA: hypothetical protein VHX39_00350, partial [Acetobacteraceae bacterium]|nr:hypothetical protein [Acetobacteraceae bacterium]